MKGAILQRISAYVMTALLVVASTRTASAQLRGPGLPALAVASKKLVPGLWVRYAIVNTGASLDHDSTMLDFSSLAPGVVTGGNCVIGDHAAIGIGAVIAHGVTVGDHAVVGAGSTVLKDIARFSVAYGSPARFVRERAVGAKYL